MNNRAFYNFCREQRKIESDPHKRAALIDVYNFIRECGISRNGVNRYIDARLRDPRTSPEMITAYKWLRDTFDAPAPGAQPQGLQALL